jgi:uncharacterized protein
MKYLVVVLVVLAVLWIVRTSSRSGDDGGSAAAGRRSPAQPQDMVECPVCAVHLPRTEALAGPGGQLYCCAEHRARAGG